MHARLTATAPESPAALMRRAADHLSAMAKNATLGPWSVSKTILNDIGILDHDGAEIVVAYDESDAALIVALRPLAPLWAASLRATADRWEANNTLDRPESGEMQPNHPEAWWCGSCQGAIDSPDYPGDDQRCTCGWWTEALAVARAVLGETAPDLPGDAPEPVDTVPPPIGSWVVRAGESLPGAPLPPRGRVLNVVRGGMALVDWGLETNWEPVASLRVLGETEG